MDEERVGKLESDIVRVVQGEGREGYKYMVVLHIQEGSLAPPMFPREDLGESGTHGVVGGVDSARDLRVRNRNVKYGSVVLKPSIILG